MVENTEFINLTLSSRDAAAILNPATASVSVEDGDSKLTITNDFDLVVVTIYSTYCQSNETLQLLVFMQLNFKFVVNCLSLTSALLTVFNADFPAI